MTAAAFAREPTVLPFPDVDSSVAANSLKVPHWNATASDIKATTELEAVSAMVQHPPHYARHVEAERKLPPNPLSSLGVALAREQLAEEAIATAYDSFVGQIERIYQTHQWRARMVGERLDYSLPLLRDLVENYLATRACFYCGGQLSRVTVSVDLKNPPSRGGSYAFYNVAVCCKDCQRAKGNLDHIEYRELLGLLRSWAAPIRRQFLRRLALAPSRKDVVK